MASCGQGRITRRISPVLRRRFMYVRLCRAARANVQLADELIAVLHHYRFPLTGEVRRSAARMAKTGAAADGKKA